MNKMLATITRSAATIIIVILAVLAGVWMWNHYERSPWTRDGRVRADVVRVTPDIPGLITQVAVRDNQVVKPGDLLFVIDRPRYALALDQAQAQIASAKATLAQARREAARDVGLGDLVAAETHEQNVARVETARAALAVAMTGVEAANLNLARTEVRAPVNGIVTNLDLHPGDFIAAGQQAMALVDTDSLRIEGYFEETKLPRIHVGDRVRVTPMNGGAVLGGTVDSLAAGIADRDRSTSANLLPSVTPTFNWVRLAQRVPVRVRLDPLPADLHLVAGQTVTVQVVEPPAAATKG